MFLPRLSKIKKRHPFSGRRFFRLWSGLAKRKRSFIISLQRRREIAPVFAAVHGGDGMNPHIAMGIFALYVVLVSLSRLMGSREFPRLTSMKKVWGRSRGIALHFLANVALPLVLGIVFMSRGIVGIGAEQTAIKDDVSTWKTAICALTAPTNESASLTIACLDSAPEAIESPEALPQPADYQNLPAIPP